MNGRLELLAAYPFERLAKLKAGATPPAKLPHIAMSIGEPQHEPPSFILDGEGSMPRWIERIDRGKVALLSHRKGLFRERFQGVTCFPANGVSRRSEWS